MTMRVYLMLAVAIGTFAGGCRQDPRLNYHFEAAANEKRMLEDLIWELEQENEALQREVTSCREDASATSRSGTSKEPEELDIQTEPRSQSETPSTKKSGNGSKSRKPAAPPKTNGDAIDPDDIELKIEPGTEVSPGSSDSDSDPASAPSTGIGGQEELPEPETDPDAAPADSDSMEGDVHPGTEDEAAADIDESEDVSSTSGFEEVTQIYLHPQLTGGLELNGGPGDDGLTVVIEPRTVNGRYVSEAGAVSIALIDPQTRNRVARWDFSESETLQQMHESASSRGIRLELPWPAAPPETGRLRIVARFTTIDGRQLETSREVLLKLPGDFTSTWTPRTRSNAPAEAAPDSEPPAVRTDPVATPGTAAPAAVQPIRRPDSRPEQASRPRPLWRPYR